VVVFSKMDYCNSLYALYIIEKKALACLQNIQNAAARLIKSAKKMDHVTPLLRSSNWLPVKLRVQYKIILLVFEALHNLAPQYLSELVSVYTPSRALRSEHLNLLVTARTNWKRKGDRAFSRINTKSHITDVLGRLLTIRQYPPF